MSRIERIIKEAAGLFLTGLSRDSTDHGCRYRYHSDLGASKWGKAGTCILTLKSEGEDARVSSGPSRGGL